MKICTICNRPAMSGRIVHTECAAEIKRLRTENAKLKAELEFRRNPVPDLLIESTDGTTKINPRVTEWVRELLSTPPTTEGVKDGGQNQ